MHNILTDQLIRMDTRDRGRVSASLPDVYAALMEDEVDAFPALRPHQRHAWHAFLVQLGAMALRHADASEPPPDSKTWAALIRGLTPDYQDDEPWHLVIDDITKPAFMQPPASSADKRKEYKTVGSPDELDMLVMSKNHDLKAGAGASGGIDDWLFALVSLQTQEGYAGAGNFGISRMNGGLGCRPGFSITPSTRSGAHVRRDVQALLDGWEELLRGGTPAGAFDLLWTLTWDGTKAEALPFEQLAPLYVEVCRRVRLYAGTREAIHAVRATSKYTRIEAKALTGRTGDPWTPINRKEGKSLTLSTAGFTYKRTADYLMSADWLPAPLLLKPTREEMRSGETLHLVARGMVRGQGKTEGYHERVVPIRGRVAKGVFGRQGGVQELGDIAQKRIEYVRVVQRILRHAVWTFAAGGKTEGVGDEQRARANPWADKLNEMVDADFFDALQDEFEKESASDRERIRNEWLRGVVRHARSILRQSQDSLPCPAIQQYRARERSDSVFEGRIRGNDGLPFLFTEKGDDDDN